MALDSTVGGSVSNSYIDEDSASSYFETILNSSAWNEADSPTRESALITATRLLDNNVEYVGEIVSDTQALRWPRNHVYDLDGRLYANDSIPSDFLNIVCDLALFVIESGGYTASTNQFKQIDIGSIGLKYKDENSFTIPASVLEAIKLFGVYTGIVSSRQAYNCKLTRC